MSISILKKKQTHRGLVARENGINLSSEEITFFDTVKSEIQEKWQKQK